MITTRVVRQLQKLIAPICQRAEAYANVEPTARTAQSITLAALPANLTPAQLLYGVAMFPDAGDDAVITSVTEAEGGAWVLSWPYALPLTTGAVYIGTGVLSACAFAIGVGSNESRLVVVDPEENQIALGAAPGCDVRTGNLDIIFEMRLGEPAGTVAAAAHLATMLAAEAIVHAIRDAWGPSFTVVPVGIQWGRTNHGTERGQATHYGHRIMCEYTE